MKRRITALIVLLVFSNLAVAHPFASGGGGSSSADDDSNLTIIITAVIVLGVGGLFIADILSDKDENSQDALAGITEEPFVEETGVNWGNLTGDEELAMPLLAISVFPGDNGRNLATYFSNLITPGENLYYTVYSSPVSFGNMSAAESAETGFSFLECQWFMATGNSGLELYTVNSDDSPWQFNSTQWDSAVVRDASSSFLEYSFER